MPYLPQYGGLINSQVGPLSGTLAACPFKAILERGLAITRNYHRFAVRQLRMPAYDPKRTFALAGIVH